MRELAREFLAAFETGAVDIPPPSLADPAFDLPAAYVVEAEFARLRRADGHYPVGRKVGYANKAIWRALKLESLVWAHMYDDTVRFAAQDGATGFALANCGAPKIEPELVFKLKHAAGTGGLDAVTALENVEWMAIGFEIIDCPFPNWQFKPADFVAAFGLHKALLIGHPTNLDSLSMADLPAALSGFKVRLMKNGQPVDEGGGKNSLRSPALCLAELARIAPLSAGEIISTGTLTAAQAIAADDKWEVKVEGLSALNLAITII